jgi:uncharacterized membrane protein
MAPAFVLWPGVAGVVSLSIGFYAVRKDLVTAHGLDKLRVLACVFFAAPLATFGAEHLTDARDIVQIVPPWMPARLFWTYFVGIALLAAALSFSLKKGLRLAAPLTALMFLLFVLMMHIPAVVAAPRDRFAWAIAFRDLTFGCGALALAAGQNPNAVARSKKVAIVVARGLMGIAVIVYGIEQFLHPQFAPGVPLKKLTPVWLPAPHVWVYITATILVVAGVLLLVGRYSAEAATAVGLLMTVLTVFLYVPILALAKNAQEVLVGINYVFDTLLYGGALLLLANALSGVRERRPMLKCLTAA